MYYHNLTSLPVLLISLPYLSSPCSATMTMPQCVAPTIRTIRTSVCSAEMPASSSLKSSLCQKDTVLLVCMFTSLNHRCIIKRNLQRSLIPTHLSSKHWTNAQSNLFGQNIIKGRRQHFCYLCMKAANCIYKAKLQKKKRNEIQF